MLRGRLQFIEAYNGAGLLSFREYFDQKSAAQQEDLRVALDAIDREISARWSTFTRLGEALFVLEACLDRRSLPQWIADNEWKDVAAGDLVWQGGLGYCVIQTPATKAGSPSSSRS